MDTLAKVSHLASDLGVVTPVDDNTKPPMLSQDTQEPPQSAR